ncbi:MAG: SUMF1/EgtB/PvdO family nonheme iron enzyme [Kiritimatiellae bacterium]|nr:SUMF1/EgtB/PvdO family nonheme iron enzyme [Kiritimatiellia bacterium]
MRRYPWLVTALLGLCLAGSGAPDDAQEIKTPSGVDMVRVPGGTCVMGCDNGRPDEKPAHDVAVGPFYMDKYEVTQEHYKKIMEGDNPSRWKGAKLPVEQVWWVSAARYCNERSLWEELDPCYDEETWECDFTANGYRLPTEAEWEYACRAGSTTSYSFGDNAGKLQFFAWHKSNSGEKTREVGQKKPNAWGLYDMHGGTWEWCNDFYAENYYAQSPKDNPTGPKTGAKRVMRGGSVADDEAYCRSATRHAEAMSPPDVCVGFNVFGFRCVRKAAR